MVANVGFGALGKHDAALTARAFQDVQEAQHRYLDILSTAFDHLVEAGHWGDAVQLVIEMGRISESDLARGLEVTRSTVNRWASGQTVPQARATRHMAEKIQRMLSY